MFIIIYILLLPTLTERMMSPRSFEWSLTFPPLIESTLLRPTLMELGGLALVDSRVITLSDDIAFFFFVGLRRLSAMA